MRHLDSTAPACAELAADGPVPKRVTSVLFGDLVGFTPLSESRDPEEVRELLSRYFDASRHGRRPVRRDDREVHRRRRHGGLGRAGQRTRTTPSARSAPGSTSSTGRPRLGEEVGAPGLGTARRRRHRRGRRDARRRRQGMVAGDTVNTAARVQSAADAGRGLGRRDDPRPHRGSDRYADAGEHALKGKAEPGPLLASRARGRRPSAVRSGSTVSRRRSSVASASCGWSRSCSTPPWRTGARGWSLVAGDAGDRQEPAGVGVREVRRRAHRPRCGGTAGAASSYGEGVAFWALAEMVRGRLGLSEGDDEAVVTARSDDGLRQVRAGPEDERAWLGRALRALLGAGVAGGRCPRGHLRGWTAFFERLGDRRPGGPARRGRAVRRRGLCSTSSTTRCQPLASRSSSLALSGPELSSERRHARWARRSTTIQLERSR